MSNKERRNSGRIAVEMWVEGITEDGDSYFQRSGNLSLGGLYLDRAVPHEPGTRLKLCFSLPGDEEPIEVIGEILAHHDEEGLGMGVKFLSVTETQRKKIQNFIEKSLTMK